LIQLLILQLRQERRWVLWNKLLVAHWIRQDDDPSLSGPRRICAFRILPSGTPFDAPLFTGFNLDEFG
jgi:hypothetical protein